VVSRDAFIEARWSTVICAPVYSTIRGVETEVIVGEESGLKHPSAIACDALVSLARGLLTDFLGTLPRDRVVALDRALALAVGVEHLLDT
jgi:mRNA interferase MazF